MDGDVQGLNIFLYSRKYEEIDPHKTTVTKFNTIHNNNEDQIFYIITRNIDNTLCHIGGADIKIDANHRTRVKIRDCNNGRYICAISYYRLGSNSFDIKVNGVKIGDTRHVTVTETNEWIFGCIIYYAILGFLYPLIGCG